jgi:hypothetical protein
MPIVSFEVELKPDDVTWEERKARLAAMPEVPESEIDLSIVNALDNQNSYVCFASASHSAPRRRRLAPFSAQSSAFALSMSE